MIANNSYTFKELSEEEKRRAVQQVIHFIKEEGPDYDEDHQRVAKIIEEKLREAQLDVKYIEWDSEKGITLDDIDLKVTDRFLKKNLSVEEFQLYEEIYSANGGALVHRILQKEDEYGYVLEAEESMGYDLKDIMEFLVKYGSEDVKVRYQFPLLMEEKELTDEEYSNLYGDLDAVSVKFFGEFKHKLDPIAKELARYVIETNEKHINYLGTEEYYLEKLNKENNFRSDVEGNLLEG